MPITVVELLTSVEVLTEVLSDKTEPPVAVESTGGVPVEFSRLETEGEAEPTTGGPCEMCGGIWPDSDRSELNREELGAGKVLEEDKELDNDEVLDTDKELNSEVELKSITEAREDRQIWEEPEINSDSELSIDMELNSDRALSPDKELSSDKE